MSVAIPQQSVELERHQRSPFPLPLTAFEKFMLADGDNDYPMQFYLQVKLRGVVDRDIMKIAVAGAFRRHPLLHCRIRRISGVLHWIWAGENFPEADWDSDSWESREPWKQSINLHQEVGLRVWAKQFDEFAELTLQFHHACCDGIGASQFLQDVAIGYAREYALRNHETDVPELQPLEPLSLRQRNDSEGRRVANLDGSIIRRFRILLKYTFRYLRQRKIGWERPAKDTTDKQVGVGIRQVNLSRKQTRQIRDYAKCHNSSINDVLVTELMLFADKWNALQKPKKRWFSFKQPTLCVLVPTSLRGPNDTSLPACNVVSYVFMARAQKLVSSPVKLLESIRDEMQLVHKFQAGWFFVQVIESLSKIPGGLKAIMLSNRRRCMSTTVLSHMGNLLNAIGGRLPRIDKKIRMGNLAVEEIYGVPPIRHGTTVVFSSMMIGGCLKICVRCCDRTFSESATQNLVHLLKNHFEHVGDNRNH